jgi:hypothetical protein
MVDDSCIILLTVKWASFVEHWNIDTGIKIDHQENKGCELENYQMWLQGVVVINLCIHIAELLWSKFAGATPACGRIWWLN